MLSEYAQQEVSPAGSSSRPSWLRLVISPALLTPEIENFPYPGAGTTADPHIVSWLPGTLDPRNPRNFSAARRWLVTILAAISCFSISFTSSVYTGGISGITDEFGVSNSLAQAGVSLFVVGFAVGPLFWAPLSEVYGRQLVFVMTFGALVVFNALGAASGSIAQLLVFRALAGIVGSSPLTNAGALIADMFDADNRGLAIGLFSFGPYMGPVMGPIVGGYLGASSGGWRAILWLCTGLGGVLWVLCTILTPETYAPVLLARRAAALSKKTQKVYISHLDQGAASMTAASVLWTGLSRPWALLVLEPIVLIISLYMAIVYATMYMLFAAYPIIFRQGRGWSAGSAGLAFIPMAVGLVIALAYMVYENERYKKRAARTANGRAPPEARLPVCMAGSVFVPIGLFWFAWTNSPETHWIVCLLGTTVFGIGNVLLYLSAINYLVDAYVVYTASCMAGSSVLRSLLGAAFPLFTGSMYRDLGIHWASSVPAFLALACVPFPFLFAKYGARIRRHCRYAARAQAIMEKLNDENSNS
ncbi:MFS general substrate transporter [Whalleya microplaca]|nr:MFS general substrate transporter [Whalleya microplaca]